MMMKEVLDNSIYNFKFNKSINLPRRSVSAIRVGYQCMLGTCLVDIKLHWEWLICRMDRISQIFFVKITESYIYCAMSFCTTNDNFILNNSLKLSLFWFTFFLLELSHPLLGMPLEFPRQFSVIEQIEKLKYFGQINWNQIPFTWTLCRMTR